MAITCCLLILLAAYLFASHAYWQSPRGRIVALNRMYEGILINMMSETYKRSGSDFGVWQNSPLLVTLPVKERIPPQMTHTEFVKVTTAVFRDYMDTHPDKSPVFLNYTQPTIGDFKNYVDPRAEIVEQLRQDGYPADYGRHGENPADEVGFGYWGTELSILCVDNYGEDGYVVAVFTQGGCVGNTELAYISRNQISPDYEVVWHSQLVDDVLSGLEDRERRVALGVRD